MHFPEISKLPADEFVDRFLGKIVHNSRTLFFIDPHGYTELSQEKLDALLQNSHIEILIFIPTSHIYRFINREEPRETVAPVLDFLQNCNIDIEEMKRKGLSGFHLSLKENLTRRANTQYVYDYPLKNKTASNSEHCLFFIGHNDKGAEKFLDAVDKINREFKWPLFGADPIDLTVYINLESFLAEKCEEFRSNCDIRKWGLQNGYRSQVITPSLKKCKRKKS